MNCYRILKESLLCAVLALSIACGSGGSTNNDPNPDDGQTGVNLASYVNPRAVTIIGYDGDAMEPYISRDGNGLFFNNLNAPMLTNGEDNDTNIHFASRIDDTTFEYIGPVTGADTDNISGDNELEGVASMDASGKFYFVRTIDYFDSGSPDYLRSLYRADYTNGALSNLESIANLKTTRADNESPVVGELNFDAEIHQDGTELYFVEGLFSGNPYPDEANIALAHLENNEFVIDSASLELFSQINTDALEYAPAISTDRLTLFFTRATGIGSNTIDLGIYLATRNSTSDPWRNVTRIDAIAGELTEGPSITADSSLLYYHQRVQGQFKIFVVSKE